MSCARNRKKQVIVANHGGAHLVQNAISFDVLALRSALRMIENIAKFKTSWLSESSDLRKLIKDKALGACVLGTAASVWWAGKKVDRFINLEASDQIVGQIRMQNFDLTIIVHISITVDVGNSSKSKDIKKLLVYWKWALYSAVSF